MSKMTKSFMDPSLPLIRWSITMPYDSQNPMSYDPIVMDTPDIATVMRMHATMNRIFMEVMCLYFEINSSSPTSMTP